MKKQRSKNNTIVDAEAHFDAKMAKSCIKDHGMIINFSSKRRELKASKQEKGIPRIVKENFTYGEMQKINKIHKEYLSELKGKHVPSTFMDVLYRAELTGAEISIAGKTGIVIEERKNVMVVIFPCDIIKIYPKNKYDFSINIDEVDYIFYGSNLKINRMLK
ncbi:hypothetical protein ENBRE01_1054 [Enteropsectra breve]|nr:hypothetical protein ENBRE01_1054 [Enteropsectra breve]